MRQWTIDAFASAPFKGNPACVVEPLGAWPTDGAMHALAAENNQAETAFLLRTDDPARFGLRWRTPAIEVPLCGHATLASAHALFAELGARSDLLSFDTLSGVLTVRRLERGYELNFPADRPQRCEPPEGLTETLGAEPAEVWTGRVLVAILADEATVRGLKPDLAAIARITGDPSRMQGDVAVTALADPGGDHDVVSRFFAPGAGIPEDPTTGVLHTMLSPLFSAKLGRPTLRFHQAYPGRGGDLTCEHAGERVLMRGDAVTVVESRLRFALD
jgi:PhzF family phenazine biosynthesis protein